MLDDLSTCHAVDAHRLDLYLPGARRHSEEWSPGMGCPRGCPDRHQIAIAHDLLYRLLAVREGRHDHRVPRLGTGEARWRSRRRVVADEVGRDQIVQGIRVIPSPRLFDSTDDLLCIGHCYDSFVYQLRPASRPEHS